MSIAGSVPGLSLSPRMYTGFSLLGLLLLVAAIACSGPVLWWRLLSDKSHSDAPYYLYLSASYKEEHGSSNVGGWFL